MSLTEISVRVAVVTVLALVALVAIGWRRSASDYRGRTPSSSAAATDTPHHDVDHSRSTTGVHDTGRVVARKFLDVLGLGSIAAFVGIVVALIVASAIAWMVTALLDRL